MTSETSKTSYFNTLIFTIVTGIISLLLLLSLFIPVVNQNAFYFIIAVEAGIFSVIAICIFKIMYNEYEVNKRMRNLKTTKLSLNECPEYFVRTKNGSDTNCTNNYKVQDSNGQKYTLRIYPDDPLTPLPTTLPAATQDKNEVFMLHQLEQAVDLKDASAQCAMVMKEPPINTATTAAQANTLRQYVGYSKLPWMYAQSRCAPYA